MFKLKDFKFESNLGKGSFGTVYKCLDKKTQQEYAIKKIRDEDRFRKAAKKEIEALNFLMKYQIDNIYFPIIKFYGNFLDNNIPYLVFELLDVDLYYYQLKNYYQFDLIFIKNVAFQLCRGLSFIHLKYIHTDLKPENIMINKKTKNIKIIDLGSVLEICTDKKYFYHQSRYYRSPDVIYNLKFNEKIDIWSLGCIISELITNKPLFKGGNERDLIFKMTEKIDIPKEEKYLKSKKFNSFFSSYDMYDDKDEFFRINDKYTISKKYNINGYCLDKYIKKYLIFFKNSDIIKNNILDFILKIIVYDFHKRPNIDDCLKHKLFL